MINALNDYFRQQGLTDDIQLQEEVCFDIETYPNYFNISFLFRDEYSIGFEMKNNEPFAYFHAAMFIVQNFILVGFNSNNYDIPMLEYFLGQKANNDDLYKLSLHLTNDAKWYQIAHEYERFNSAFLNTYDLFKVAPDPANPSLKMYSARLLADNLQDLPYSPYETLTDGQMQVVAKYCLNDIKKTKLLKDALAIEIDMRKFMNRQYKMDLRSLSDAQIGERVATKLCQAKLGRKIQQVNIKTHYAQPLKYYPPTYINFKTELLQNTLNLIQSLEFHLDENGSPVLPSELESVNLKIGSTAYNIQMGGLHSTEKTQSYTCDEQHRISDIDVDSFYPYIIINNRYFPRHIGEVFLDVYENELVKPRIEHKRLSADETLSKEERFVQKQLSNSKKIVINGIYGKLGNKYSKIYAPEMMLSVCLTGQLSLLMLIERLELAGLKVISANTDGIVIYYNVEQRDILTSIVKQWELDCNFTTEENFYHGLHSRDVNNYIALKSDKDCQIIKGTKLKGVYTDYWYSDVNSFRMKNTPDFIICRQAAVKYIIDGTPIEETIKQCDDILKFCSLRNVRGGGWFRGKPFGRVARFYKSSVSRDCLLSNKKTMVSNSRNAELCLNLPTTFPADIDYQFYIAYAEQILYDTGYMVKNYVPDLF